MNCCIVSCKIVIWLFYKFYIFFWNYIDSIVGLKVISESDKYVYIVMELCEGGGEVK